MIQGTSYSVALLLVVFVASIENEALMVEWSEVAEAFADADEFDPVLTTGLLYGGINYVLGLILSVVYLHPLYRAYGHARFYLAKLLGFVLVPAFLLAYFSVGYFLFVQHSFSLVAICVLYWSFTRINLRSRS